MTHTPYDSHTLRLAAGRAVDHAQLSRGDLVMDGMLSTVAQAMVPIYRQYVTLN